MARHTGTIALAAHWPPNMPLLPELGWLLGGSVATNMPLLRSCFAQVLCHRKQRGMKFCQEAAVPWHVRKNRLASAVGKQDDSGVHYATAANGNQDAPVAPALLAGSGGKEGAVSQ
jgi:hypothetical protein